MEFVDDTGQVFFRRQPLPFSLCTRYQDKKRASAAPPGGVGGAAAAAAAPPTSEPLLVAVGTADALARCAHSRVRAHRLCCSCLPPGLAAPEPRNIRQPCGGGAVLVVPDNSVPIRPASGGSSGSRSRSTPRTREAARTDLASVATANPNCGLGLGGSPEVVVCREAESCECNCGTEEWWSPSGEYIIQFLISHTSFITTDQLLRLFLSHLELAKCDEDRLRVVNIVRRWVTILPQDFYPETYENETALLKWSKAATALMFVQLPRLGASSALGALPHTVLVHLIRFLKPPTPPTFLALKKFISQIPSPHIKNSMSQFISQRFRICSPVSPPIIALHTPTVPASETLPSASGTDFLETVSPRLIAEQLTLLVWHIWSTINPREFIRWGSLQGTLPSKEKVTPGICKLISNFNKLSVAVSAAILSRPEVKKRASLLCKMIELANALRELKNFHCLGAVACGLNHSAIVRLKATWDLVSKKKRDLLEDHLNTLSPKAGFILYRKLELHHDRVSPFIPYIGIRLVDFVFLEDGNPSYYRNDTCEYFNFIKFAQLSNHILDIQDLQQSTYKFTPNEPCLVSIDQWVNSQVQESPDESLLQLSFIREPPGPSSSTS
ncbi:Ras guanine nucleotide exchange factor [Pelomyxa schiedti]|nr:Ras guanine nucleotide exchange factor [Pelomyxa schiedti]